MKHETAGDPMSGLKWTRKTTEKIASELRTSGIGVSPNTVGRLLKQHGLLAPGQPQAIGPGLQESRPKTETHSSTHIAQLRKHCVARGLPLISVDTKKKELIGTLQEPRCRLEP